MKRATLLKAISSASTGHGSWAVCSSSDGAELNLPEHGKCSASTGSNQCVRLDYEVSFIRPMGVNASSKTKLLLR